MFKEVLRCVDLPRMQMSVGQRSFALYGPTVWNSLPSALRDSSLSLNTFQQRLRLVYSVRSTTLQPHYSSSMQPPLASGAAKDHFQDCSPRIQGVAPPYLQEFCVPVDWRMFKDVLDCGRYRLDVSTCQEYRRRWASAASPSTGTQCGTVCHQHCVTAACH